MWLLFAEGFFPALICTHQFQETKLHLRSIHIVKMSWWLKTQEALLENQKRIGNKTRKVCGLSRVYNNCEIGQGIDVDCCVIEFCFPWIFSPMAQLKDSFFSGCTTFPFWTNFYYFPWILKAFVNPQVDNTSIPPEDKDYDFQISQFGLMTCFHCYFFVYTCLQDVQHLDKCNTYALPHYWYL